MKKILSLIALLLIIKANAFSYNIKGAINDSTTNESLIGASIMIKPRNIGVITNIEGKYELKSIEAGEYDIQVSYTGYKTINRKIKILSDTVINFRLIESALKLTEVSVKAKANKESVNEQVKQQEKSAVVQDGLSGDAIKKTPDSKASDAMKRVSGASIQDNKYVVIRGLSDRYNFALINGAPLPSSESDRRAFSFDIFPSNMLDGLTIIKSASSYLPGEFSGGVINVSTTEVKDKNSQSIQFGLGFNTISTFNSFYLNDKASYSMPSLPSTQEFSDLNRDQKGDLAKKMNFTWSPNSRTALPQGSLQYSINRNYKNFGFVFSYFFQNQETFNRTTRRDFEEQSLGVIQKMELNDKVYSQNLMNSFMLNTEWNINKNNKIKFKNLYSINSEDKVNIRTGVREMDNDPRQWEKSNNFWYTKNNLLTQQLIGSHKLNKSHLNWNLGLSDVQRDIPNLRRVVYRKYSLLENDETEKYVAVIQNNGTIPTAAGNMFWSNSSERIYSLNYDYNFDFNVKKIENQIKIGAWHQLRSREFTSRNFGFSQYKPSGSTFNSDLLLLSPDKIFSQENLGLLSDGRGGFKLDEATNVDDSYDASSNLNAAFVNVDSKVSKLRVVTGVRVESYNQKFNYIEFGSNKPQRLDTTIVDFLPSINLIYSLTEKMKLRGSYSKTVSRPEFRELAPFSFYNFINDNIISGNPDLKRARIDNLDLRWEMYPGSGQILSISGFYKRFENPIELINRTGTSGAPELFYTNVESSKSYGLEFEARVNLGNALDLDKLKTLTIYSNAAIIKSEVNLSNFVGSGGNRPLQGQSPYIINSALNWNSKDQKTGFSVSYNFIGPRIFIVGNVQEPSVWENGRQLIDLQFSKKVNKFEFKFNVRDLLAQDLVFFQDLNNNKKFDKSDNKWQQISFGQTISISAKYSF